MMMAVRTIKFHCAAPRDDRSSYDFDIRGSKRRKMEKIPYWKITEARKTRRSKALSIEFRIANPNRVRFKIRPKIAYGFRFQLIAYGPLD